MNINHGQWARKGWTDLTFKQIADLAGAPTEVDLLNDFIVEVDKGNRRVRVIWTEKRDSTSVTSE